MTILPAKIALSPEVAELGISVASIFLVENVENLSAAFEKLESKFRILDALNAGTEKDLLKMASSLHDISGNVLREYMNLLEEREILYSNMSKNIFDVLESKKFRELWALVRSSFETEAVSVLLSRWRDVHIPSIRRARLSVIMLVFRRARERGVEGAQLDAGFAEWFMTAPQEETGSWQETAHLLAVPESADRLLRSIHMASRDRTDRIPGLSV